MIWRPCKKRAPCCERTKTGKDSMIRRLRQKSYDMAVLISDTNIEKYVNIQHPTFCIVVCSRKNIVWLKASYSNIGRGMISIFSLLQYQTNPTSGQSDLPGQSPFPCPCPCPCSCSFPCSHPLIHVLFHGHVEWIWKWTWTWARAWTWKWTRTWRRRALKRTWTWTDMSTEMDIDQKFGPISNIMRDFVFFSVISEVPVSGSVQFHPMGHWYIEDLHAFNKTHTW